MTEELPLLVPELDVVDLAVSVEIYCEVFGFRVAYRREDEAFAMLVRTGVAIMLQASEGPGRRFRTAPLERPFGRGVNFQIEIDDLDAVYAAVIKRGLEIVIPMEERSYLVGDRQRRQRQFVVADPDKFLLRFCAIPPSPTRSPDSSRGPRPSRA